VLVGRGPNIDDVVAAFEPFVARSRSVRSTIGITCLREADV
jgi:hypothetical protein